MGITGNVLIGMTGGEEGQGSGVIRDEEIKHN